MQDKQLALILFVPKFDMNRDATVCYGRGVEWSDPTTSVFYNVVNRRKKPAVVFKRQLIARILPINTHDSEIFDRLFNVGSPTSDRPNLCPLQSLLPNVGLTILPAAFTRILERALGNLHPGMVSWLDDTLVSS